MRQRIPVGLTLGLFVLVVALFSPVNRAIEFYFGASDIPKATASGSLRQTELLGRWKLIPNMASLQKSAMRARSDDPSRSIDEYILWFQKHSTTYSFSELGEVELCESIDGELQRTHLGTYIVSDISDSHEDLLIELKLHENGQRIIKRWRIMPDLSHQDGRHDWVVTSEGFQLGRLVLQPNKP